MNDQQHEKVKKKTDTIRPRNPFATDPIMKKGGVHDVPKESKRSHNKQQLKKTLQITHEEDI